MSSVVAVDHFDAVLFDLDGVLTTTRAVHAAAWKQTFDDFLAVVGRSCTERARTASTTRPTTPPTSTASRAQDGVRDFLASRGIELPEGGPDSPPDGGLGVGPGQP